MPNNAGRSPHHPRPAPAQVPLSRLRLCVRLAGLTLTMMCQKVARLSSNLGQAPLSTQTMSWAGSSCSSADDTVWLGPTLTLLGALWTLRWLAWATMRGCC